MVTPRKSGRGGTTSFAVAGLMLALFLVALDQTVVGTALPRIIADLEGFERYAWVTISYHLASTSMFGTVVMAFGVYLLTTLDVSFSMNTVALFLTVTGLWLIMPTVTLAVQATVDRKVPGVATSAAQFVRSVGSTVHRGLRRGYSVRPL